MIRFPQVHFVKGVVALQHFPEAVLPSFAFMGRSNVGKSSLLNALWGRRAYAYTSKKPGKTAEINFFNVDEQFYCVDMPGYGFAKVNPMVQKVWHNLIPQYIERTSNLLRTFVLIDSRHLPKESDLEVLTWLQDLGQPFSIILTKADKLSPAQERSQQEAIEKVLSLTLSQEHHDILTFSIKRPSTIQVLREHVEKCLKE